MKPSATGTASRWEWHQRALERLRATLTRERDDRAAAFREPAPRGGADTIDVATDQLEHAELLAALRQEEAELAQIEAALERIRIGTYGICEVTGEPIPTPRLRAVPWTRYSRAAADKPSREATR
jgi:RNA polymerase-binding transcription factor DksA